MSDLKQLCSVGAGVGRATITLTLEPVTCRARRSPPSHLGCQAAAPGHHRSAGRYLPAPRRPTDHEHVKDGQKIPQKTACSVLSHEASDLLWRTNNAGKCFSKMTDNFGTDCRQSLTDSGWWLVRQQDKRQDANTGRSHLTPYTLYLLPSTWPLHVTSTTRPANGT